MNEYYSKLFGQRTETVSEDVFYFNSEADGDCFDEDDVKLWNIVR